MIWPQGAFTAQTTSVTLPTKGYCKSHLSYPQHHHTLSFSHTHSLTHTQLFTQTPVVTFHVFFFLQSDVYVGCSSPEAILSYLQVHVFFFLHFITVFLYILSLKFKFIAERHKLFVYHPSSFVSFTFVY